MFQNINKENNESIIACHSNDPDFFKYINKSAYALREAREHHKVIEETDLKTDNYWKKISMNAEKNGIAPLEYLSMKYTNLPERQQELFEIENTYMKNSNFTNSIKKAMITNVKNRVPVIKRMQEFFNKHIKRNSKENNHDKDIEDLSR